MCHMQAGAQPDMDPITLELVATKEEELIATAQAMGGETDQ